MGDAPLDPDEVAAPRRRLHLPRGRRVRELLAGRLGGATAAIVASAAVALLFLPPVAFLVAGIWGLIAYARALYGAWRLLTGWQLGASFSYLSAVDFAARVGLTGGAYFALLLALVVVFAGLLTRGPRRLFLLPGIMLALPAAALFLFAAEATHEAVAARLHLPAALAPLLTAYALFDAVVLAALLLDPRPRRRVDARRTVPVTDPLPHREAVPAPEQQAATPLAHGAAEASPAVPADQSADQPAGDAEAMASVADDPTAHDGPAPGLTA